MTHKRKRFAIAVFECVSSLASIISSSALLKREKETRNPLQELPLYASNAPSSNRSSLPENVQRRPPSSRKAQRFSNECKYDTEKPPLWFDMLLSSTVDTDDPRCPSVACACHPVFQAHQAILRESARGSLSWTSTYEIVSCLLLFIRFVG